MHNYPNLAKQCLALTATFWLHPDIHFTWSSYVLAVEQTLITRGHVYPNSNVWTTGILFQKRCFTFWGFSILLHVQGGHWDFIWHIIGFPMKPRRSCWNSGKGEQETDKTLIMPSITHSSKHEESSASVLHSWQVINAQKQQWRF